MPQPLSSGQQLRCPHCARWHVITGYPGSEGTAYTLDMLFFDCREGRYYAGQVGGTSRFPVRQAIATEVLHRRPDAINRSIRRARNTS